MQPGGRLSVEPLEPRVLLSADLAGVQPVLSDEAVPVDHAIYVDSEQQDAQEQEGSSPILTLDVLPGDQPSQVQTGQENASSLESGQTQPSVLADVSLSNPQLASYQGSAEQVRPAQHDEIPTGSDGLPLGIRGPPAGTQGQQAIALFGVSPALFVENQGQWSDPSIRYVHDGEGIDVAMTDTGVVFRATDTDLQMFQFSASFVGANPIRPVGLDRSASLFNYYVGDQANWRQDVPSYEVVAYEEFYEGIDLRVRGLRSHVKYEFHVAPGADYSRIAVRYEGIEGLSLGQDGSLQVNLGGRGVITDDAPYIYQEIDGRRVEVAGRFVLLDNRTYSFEITGDIDPGHALVIDPDLIWSTYLGGSATDSGSGIAVDDSGDIYVTGGTGSSGWTNGGVDTTLDGSDAFVVKLNSNGVHLWSTYLGGSATDSGSGIAVDGSGDIYVTGGTGSSGWISGGFDTTLDGPGDAFVVKLNSNGVHLWSTYLGGSKGGTGSGADRGYGIAVDALGNVYVTGETSSPGWTSGGYETTYISGNEWFEDPFVVKLSSSGAHLWSTYVGHGGSGDGIAVDGSGDVYVAGKTCTSWLGGGFDSTFNGGEWDGFVAKLSSSGAHVWSTYLGGGGDDYGSGIAVAGSGDVYATGSTSSSGWPSGGYNTAYAGGGQDGFVVKLSSSGAHVWSTYVGGDGRWDAASGIAVDGSGDIYVSGRTDSSGWTSGGFDTTHNGGTLDAFVVKLSSAGAHVWSTYLGGGGSDGGSGIAVDTSGNVCVTGATNSSGWTSGGFDTTYDGGTDGFVARLTGVLDTTLPSPNPSTWATEPYATSETSIRMVATTATDIMGVEYYFDEIGGNPGGTDSGWQGSNTYEDTGLTPGTTYIYQVKTRDKSMNHNETEYSTSRAATTHPLDTTPPSPNPTTWATEPCATGETSIQMAATLATDIHGVEYYFDETSGNPGGTDSGWQDSHTYEDVGLSPSTLYTYQVKTRDKSISHNETSYSAARSATTPTDITAPSPNPSTWATEPYATSSTSIRMIAMTATDASGVEYCFEETSGNPGGTDSGWQDSSTYEDIGLSPSTMYTYQVKARDKSGAHNETSYSVTRSATAEADTAPPSPNPSTWAIEPCATFSTSISIRMTATTASDLSGVEYYFDETSGNPGGTDSGWQDSSTYEDTGLSPDATYIYQVRTRDKSINHNETGYSVARWATARTPDTTAPTISGFSVSPTLLALGGSFMITYTVSDTGGSGLNSVELWRTDNPDVWPGQPVAQNSASGDGVVTGALSDIPPSVGDWWYGIHVFDAAGNSITETQGGGQPIHVVVNYPPEVDLANEIATLAENSDTSSRIKIGDIVVTDDALGTNILSLGGVDAILFEIDGSVLYLKAGAVLDHETNPELDATVAVDDVSGEPTPDDTVSLSVAVTDVNEQPSKPTCNLPADRATAVILTPILRSSAFSDPDAGDTHDVTQWQVDNDSDFSSPVWDYEDTDSDKTRQAVPSTTLLYSTTYHWRVRYQDSSGLWSEWSDSRVFTVDRYSPVYRFWKPADNTHFYTIKESEKDKLIRDYADIYSYEGPAYYAYVKDQPPAGTLPVYRFWKPSDNTHFFTTKESEKQKLIDSFSHIYTYEGPAFYAYSTGEHPVGTLPVYRFWKPLGNTHFFTIKESEKDKLINLFSYAFTFENVVWYAYVV